MNKLSLSFSTKTIMSKLTSFSLTSQQHKSDTNVNNTTNLYFPSSPHDIPVKYPDIQTDKKREITHETISDIKPDTSGLQHTSRDIPQTEADNTDDSVVVIKTLDNKTEQLYLAVISAFANILKADNKTLITNLLDLSGKVIVKAESLIKIIALLCNVDQSKVVINYLDEEVSCVHKFNPLKKIASIKVDGKDMFIQFNQEFNRISNDFSISTDKCVVPKVVDF